MSKRHVWVVGHKNPDTDSICAAIAYAELKNRIEEKECGEESAYRYIPKRAGEVNAETAYVLAHFGVKAPEYIEDVGTQLKDIAYLHTEGVSGHISMKKAWELMKELKVVTLPVVSKTNKLEGIIVTGDIAKSYMDVYDSSALSTARTKYKNMVETLSGTVMTGNEHGYFSKGKVVMAVGSPESIANAVEEDDLVIVGDGEASQLGAIAAGCCCMVVTSGLAIGARVLSEAVKRDVIIISTEYDFFTTARLITQSMPIKYFMTKDNLVHFELDDYVDEVRAITAKLRHRAFPIVDENENYVGIFSRRSLLDSQKKQVILVDHNEKSQAVNNIEEAEILEIIDHHRLGSLETMAPVYFRNQPLGCTSTIIYQMYQEKGIEITPEIASLLCAAIISDTLMFRSPTCTEIDKRAAECLAEIAGIDIEEFAHNMFEAGSDFEHKTEEEILNQDFKIFHSGDISFGVAQVSAMSQIELDKVKARIDKKLPTICTEKRIDMLFVMLTDIMEESTTLVYCGDDADELVQAAFESEKTDDNSVMVAGMVSRKKQLIPALMKTLAEL